jgi:hypothetical protein
MSEVVVSHATQVQRDPPPFFPRFIVIGGKISNMTTVLCRELCLALVACAVVVTASPVAWARQEVPSTASSVSTRDPFRGVLRFLKPQSGFGLRHARRDDTLSGHSLARRSMVLTSRSGPSRARYHRFAVAEIPPGGRQRWLAGSGASINGLYHGRYRYWPFGCPVPVYRAYIDPRYLFPGGVYVYYCAYPYGSAGY